ncbi:membrane protein [Amylibacter marinus]|uniref:Membrane protein n=1 Tax=Amylibacter marinus TaxID=1475483 RepID=A0ABQ5VT62_9RHOB|nr:hypothetical protein [Amylibacter marinus]GLQ34364.1 membrane protein [Amylibacter marinus]
MNKLTLSAATVALATTATGALAGGLDRATFSSAILFEEGTHAEISFATTSPKVSPQTDTAFGGAALNSAWQVTERFNTGIVRFKTDLSDKVAIAFEVNNNPYGVDINYGAFAASAFSAVSDLASLSANLSSSAMTLSGKYKVTDRFSVIGALKLVEIGGSANVSVPLAAGIGAGAVTSIGLADIGAGAGIVTLEGDSAIAPIIGVSYEIPDIALRVAASYELGVETNPIVNSINPTYSGGAGSIKTPDVMLLEFQSGVAKDTLVFGAIRRANWSDAQVTMSAVYDNLQLSDFDDSTTYTIGVGRRFSDKFSGSLTLTHAPSDCDSVSLLAPTCENNTLSIGGKYSVGNGTAISAGVSFRKYKTATSSSISPESGSIVFDGDTLRTVGVKVSRKF